MERPLDEVGVAEHVEIASGRRIALQPAAAPGQQHERAGYELLLNYGVPAELARFADTYSNPVTVEDLLVSVADTVWKGKRITKLEQRLAEHLQAAAGLEEWDAFLRLDTVLGDLAADADRLLAFQFRHPVHG